MASEPDITSSLGDGWTGALQNLSSGVLGSVGDFLGIPRASNGGTCVNSGVTDAGVFSAARLRTTLSMAVAAANTYTAYKMARLTEDVADKYASIAEDARKYYNEYYKPLELANIKEVDKLSEYDRTKSPIVAGQMLISARSKFVGELDKKLACTGRYCTGQRAAMITDALLEEAAAEASVAALASRYVDSEEIARDTLRWERRKAVLDLGRGIPAEATNYAELAAGLFGSLGTQASKGAEGAARYGMWNLNRRPTIYPDNRPPLQVTRRVFSPIETSTTNFKPQSAYKPEEPKVAVVTKPSG